MATLKELRQTRLEKLEQLKKFGIDAYPAKANKDIANIEILDRYEEHQGKEYTLAGRITSIRRHGALCFIDLKDQTGEVQLYIKEESMEEKGGIEKTLPFSELNLLDVGDFIEAYGTVVKTNTGQISLATKYVRLLVKSLRPMPNDWDGLKDKETRYRRRYLDTNINPEVFARFIRRSKFWEAHRDFFKTKGFIEINIPVLEHVTGGADAKPFVTHMDALDQDFYLRISQELNLKRLIGGGYEKVYEIGPRFRNEGLSDEHLPEHIAMEFYWAYSNYKEGMQFIEELFKYVAEKTFGTLQFKLGEFNVDLSKEWEVIEYVDIIQERFGVDVFKPDMDKIIEILKKNDVKLEGDVNINRAIDNLWKLIRKTIEGPAFVVHEPKFLSPLAKSLPENPELTERFHPIIAGSEVGNGFSELNDPQDQLARFLEQQNLRDTGDNEAQMLDIDFVEMLEYGMAPTFGYGHSERVFWILEGITAKEGIPFPPLKDEVDLETKQIYPEIYGKESDVKSSVPKEEQDFSKRIVTVLNDKVENWQLLNTVGHLSAYIGNRVEKGKLISQDTFVTKDGIKIPANSQYPIVALSADAKELTKLMQEVLKTKNIEYLVYTNDMIEYGDDKKLTKIFSKIESNDLEILGIGIFGDNETIKNLTGKFSLHK